MLPNFALTDHTSPGPPWGCHRIAFVHSSGGIGFANPSRTDGRPWDGPVNLPLPTGSHGAYPRAATGRRQRLPTRQEGLTHSARQNVVNQSGGEAEA